MKNRALHKMTEVMLVTKSTKIMLAVIGSVLAVCIAITAGVSISKRGDDIGGDTTTMQNQASSGGVPGEATTAVPTTVDPTVQLRQDILGAWTDSADMSGYEFFEDGSVNVTYVNLTVPVINLPINGTAKGTYTLSGDSLSVKFSIYSKTISKNFTASVENNTLTLYDTEEKETSTYQRKSQTSVSTSSSASTPTATITGSWVNASGDTKYTFNDNGTVSVTLTNAVVPAISSSAVSGTYSGVYMSDETAGTLTVQFTAESGKVTQKFTSLSVSDNSMSLIDEKGETVILVRQSGSSQSSELIGKWTDSTDMSGYEFKQGGIVDITYVNFVVPVINTPINGKYSGTYTLEGNKITITSSIYSKTVVNSYTYTISDNVLTLISTENGEVSTYSKK